jgi:hypothetical protein
MSEIVESSILNDYLESSYKLQVSDSDEFIESGEWYYIQSNVKNNIGLLKSLQSNNLLPDEVNMCDAGIGLGTILFDLYLQSKEFTDKKFTFTGIEKYKIYLDYLNNNLIKYWNNQLELIHDDIMNQDFSKYNFIYFYTPFRTSNKLMSFYLKIVNEMPKGGIVIGLDHYRTQTYGSPELIEKFRELKYYNLENQVFQKL